MHESLKVQAKEKEERLLEQAKQEKDEFYRIVDNIKALNEADKIKEEEMAQFKRKHAIEIKKQTLLLFRASLLCPLFVVGCHGHPTS